MREDVFESADGLRGLPVQSPGAGEVVESEDLSRPPAGQVLVDGEEGGLVAAVVGRPRLPDERGVALRGRWGRGGSSVPGLSFLRSRRRPEGRRGKSESQDKEKWHRPF